MLFYYFIISQIDEAGEPPSYLCNIIYDDDDASTVAVTMTRVPYNFANFPNSRFSFYRPNCGCGGSGVGFIMSSKNII